MKLKDIVNIKSGYFYRPCRNGEVTYYNISDFDETGKITAKDFKGFSSRIANTAHYLQDGDILFAAKGPKNFAWLYEGQQAPAIASSSFYVIRPDKKKVLPRFLHFYLNQLQVLNQLKRKAEGTSLPMIRKGDLENLDIKLPPLPEQEKFVQFFELAEKEKKLSKRLMAFKQNYYQQIIWNKINQI